MENNYSDSQSVKLETVEVKGFRSCQDTLLTLNSKLTVLIGINGSGKTNILQAIRLLDTHRFRLGFDPAERKAQVADAQITAWFRFKGLRIGLKIGFSASETSRRGDEFIPISESWNLAAINDVKGWLFLPIPFLSDDFSRKHFAMRLERLGQLNLTKEFGFGTKSWEVLDDKRVLECIEAINSFRKSIAYYSASQFTDPTRCPSSFEVSEEGRLSDTASSASASHLRFIYEVYRLKKSNPSLYERYCDFVSRQQLGLVSRITWKEVELSSYSAEVRTGNVSKVRKTKTLVIPKVQIGGAYITFNQLSEGTFKTLALAFYIMTDASQFLMVEEPEVCVHHGLLSRLIATLKSYSVSKQTVVSTHSDILLDELGPENIVVVQLSKHGTTATSLEKWLSVREKEALSEYLEESGTLGEYWRSGGLH